MFASACQWRVCFFCAFVNRGLCVCALALMWVLIMEMAGISHDYLKRIRAEVSRSALTYLFSREGIGATWVESNWGIFYLGNTLSHNVWLSHNYSTAFPLTSQNVEFSSSQIPRDPLWKDLPLCMVILDQLYSPWIVKWCFCTLCTLRFIRIVHQTHCDDSSKWRNGVCAKQKTKTHSLRNFLETLPF